MLGLRAAVPDVNQVDRRMRELRTAEPTPWIIHSSQSRRELPADTYLIERIGSDKIPKRVSGRVRREVIEAAANRCQVCGIGAGEKYTDFPGEYARIQLGHWVAVEQGGSRTDRSNLRAECHRCNGGIRNQTGGVTGRTSLESRAAALKRADLDRLLSWLERNRRDAEGAERLFYEANQLPPSERASFIAFLRSRAGRPA
jgi:hypothetical protein